MLKNLGEIEGIDLAEIYLSTIAKLYDPHSTYFSATTYEDFGIQMKLKLVGIGALLGLEDDVCVVKEIVPGGPADLGGQLKPNDKIISVSEKGSEPVEIIGMKLRKIVDKIRGKKGTEVHIVVQPGTATDSSARKEIVIVRDEVKLNAARARGAVFDVPGAEGKTQPIGVISLPAFYNEGDEGDTDRPIAGTGAPGSPSEKSSASRDVARLIELLKKENIQGLVLDLRHNGGGYLSEAIELAGLFITKGPVVQVKNYTGEIHVDKDNNPRIAYTGPLAVLVDRFSASASEIVTGALQNYGRAIVIGDSSTHGKGSVQQVVEMKQLTKQLALSPQKTGAAKFTIQKYYLPSGASTQLKGVVPDIVLPSINDFLKIGEADLPRALVWDQIPTSFFDGEPLDTKVLSPLRKTSLERQANLEEFAYLRKNVEWFKARQEQTTLSVNLEQRRAQKASDDAFRKEMKAERERLAKDEFAYRPFYLGPPPPPKIKAPKKDGDEDEDLDGFDDTDAAYAKADVHLRETLRVLSDAVALGRNRELWASSRPPLTASTGG
jgi:carboxyl-terminal processing protease